MVRNVTAQQFESARQTHRIAALLGCLLDEAPVSLARLASLARLPEEEVVARLQMSPYTSAHAVPTSDGRVRVLDSGAAQARRGLDDYVLAHAALKLDSPRASATSAVQIADAGGIPRDPVDGSVERLMESGGIAARVRSGKVEVDRVLTVPELGWFGQAHLRHTTSISDQAAAAVDADPWLKHALLSLHPALKRERDLFAAGFPEAAVRQAFIGLEEALRVASGVRDLTGEHLVGRALGGKEVPLIDVATYEDVDTAKNQRDGFQFLFRGGFQYIRNVHAHKSAIGYDAIVAFEYLALASMLHRGIDGARLA